MGDDSKPWRDEETLRQLYVDEDLTQAETAEGLECSTPTISNWLDRHGIETTDDRGRDSVSDDRLEDESWMRQRYVKDDCSTHEIGEEIGCSGVVVAKALSKHSIEVEQTDSRISDEDWLREAYEDDGKDEFDIADEVDRTVETVRKWLREFDIEDDFRDRNEKLADEEWLREKYWDEFLQTDEIAAEAEGSLSSVRSWLREHDIDTQPRRSGTPRELWDSDWVAEHYVEKQLSIGQIGEKIDAGDETVRYWIHRHGIETRPANDELRPDELDDELWLREHHHERRLSTREIADELDCHHGTVDDALERLGVERLSGPPIEWPEELLDEEWVRERYVSEEMSFIEIAETYEFSLSRVYDALERAGIESRDSTQYEIDADGLERLYHEEAFRLNELADHYGCSYPVITDRLERYDIERRPQWKRLSPPEFEDEDWLREQYLDRGKSGGAIATEFDVPRWIVQMWRDEYGIQADGRKPSITRGSPTNGPFDTHTAWPSDIPFGDNWDDVRFDVYEEADWRCEICYEGPYYGGNLHAHHIIPRSFVYFHPFYSLERDANDRSNLMAVCSQCHMLVEWDRLSRPESGIENRMAWLEGGV